MGCDIHLHGEVKINGKWEHWSAPSIPRDYNLFGKMAGVRDCGPPIVEPRGLPDDASVLTKIAWEHEGEDGHTPSWLSGSEIEELEKWYVTSAPPGQWRSLEHHVLGYILGNGWNVAASVAEGEDTYPAGFEDARIVFWFDN